MLIDANKEAFSVYLKSVVDFILEDGAKKRQAIPGNFRIAETDDGAQLWGSSALRYVILGRGPGKAPPPERMLAFVQKRPDILAAAKAVFRNITEKSLAFLIGRKIAKHGTDIFMGRRPGIDFLGAMDSPLEKLMQTVARNEAIQIVTGIKNELKRQQ